MCPLRSTDNVRAECAEKECAWWDDGSKVCAVKGVYDSLYGIDQSMKAEVKVSGD